MKALVTGAAGFVGSHLSERLLKDGFEVIGVDNFITGQSRNLKSLLPYSSFSFLEADVIQPLQIEGDLDWVMHFASPASPPKYLKKPFETMLVNSEGTRHLLELCRNKGASFFLASTSEVYGDPLVHPQSETYWGHVNPVGPRSIYDEAKRYAETLTVAYNQTHKVSTRIIRIFNTYGPRMDALDGRVITNFINQALEGKSLTVYGNGKQTRSFQYVDDLIEGIRRLMATNYHLPINLGNPEEFTMLELAKLVQELTDTELPVTFEKLPQDDPKQRKPDISLAIEKLNWTPKVGINQGIQMTIQYFRSLQNKQDG